MKKTILFTLALTFIITKAYTFQITYDFDLSPKCGAENLFSIHEIIEKGDNYF